MPWRAVALILLLLIGCSEPPPEAFLGGVARRDSKPFDLGTNTSGEPCSLLRGGVDSQVYPDSPEIRKTSCQPAARRFCSAHDPRWVP